MASLDDGPALKHFLDLARRGRLPGASSGEHAARQLAAAMLLRSPGMDAQAVEGAAVFLKLAWSDSVGSAKLIGG